MEYIRGPSAESCCFAQTRDWMHVWSDGGPHLCPGWLDPCSQEICAAQCFKAVSQVTLHAMGWCRKKEEGRVLLTPCWTAGHNWLGGFLAYEYQQNERMLNKLSATSHHLLWQSPASLTGKVLGSRMKITAKEWVHLRTMWFFSLDPGIWPSLCREGKSTWSHHRCFLPYGEAAGTWSTFCSRWVRATPALCHISCPARKHLVCPGGCKTTWEPSEVARSYQVLMRLTRGLAFRILEQKW